MSDPDAELLPELDAEEERALELLLRCAAHPAPIDPARHEHLLQAALLDPFAEASAQERIESERLRRALAGDGEHASLPLARALAAAYGAERASLPATLGVPERRAGVIRLPRNRSVARLATLASSLALAAAVLLLLARGNQRPRAIGPDLPLLAQSRSTAPLFVAADPGLASSRIDRIASTRARELRANRFAAWGVR